MSLVVYKQQMEILDGWHLFQQSVGNGNIHIFSKYAFGDCYVGFIGKTLKIQARLILLPFRFTQILKNFPNICLEDSL